MLAGHGQDTRRRTRSAQAWVQPAPFHPSTRLKPLWAAAFWPPATALLAELSDTALSLLNLGPGLTDVTCDHPDPFHFRISVSPPV